MRATRGALRLRGRVDDTLLGSEKRPAAMTLLFIACLSFWPQLHFPWLSHAPQRKNSSNA